MVRDGKGDAESSLSNQDKEWRYSRGVALDNEASWPMLAGEAEARYKNTEGWA